MSEFSEMMKEAFLGLERFESLPGKADLEQSIVKFDRRERLLRRLAWFSVTFQGLVMAAVLVSWFRTGDETSVRVLLAHLALFLVSMTGIGMMKLWLMVMQYHFTALKEQKRTQMMLLERSEGRGA